jgi:hypothetical protein
MPSPLRAALLAGAAACLAALAPAAAQAGPVLAPFGHACTPQDGVRFCPTTDLASRVASFDGTPIDVDVTLPATGDGPFPTLLLLHGLGGNKTAFETPTDPLYSSMHFAQQGYAVVTPTARGFGNSCGVPASRTPDCAQGWVRLDDMRYEVRDLQTLVGRLVDERVADPKAIGATGISYGGGASTMLAYLRDRIRTPSGGYAPWRSPEGTPISLRAAWPRWLWTNGESIFTRNGRGAWSRTPAGVTVQAYAGAIFAVAFGGFVAPPGSPLSADITTWKQQLDAGAVGASTQATLDNAFRYHGVAGVPGRPAPLLMQTGWTDALFPVPQALAAYDALLREDPRAPIALQVGDLGHPPASNHPADTAAFDRAGGAFLDAWLKGSGAKPRPGAITAYTTTCPASAPAGGGPYRAARFAGLARGRLAFRTRRTLRIDDKGASGALAAALNPLTSSPCTPHPADPSSHATLSLRSPGVTLLGLPVITGRVSTKGRYGQLDARLWDRDPATGRQRLITRGAYRLDVDQRGRFRFELDGNGWRFAKGHRIVVELLGRDAPTYGASIEPFRATLRGVRVTLPVRERPSRRLGVSRAG